jgi:tetratricopeptide (TPR) repeat protein
MSYIHEALKKAQREKDKLNRKYRGIPSSHAGRKALNTRRTAWWAGSFAVILFLAFAGYSWLDSRDHRIAADSRNRSKVRLSKKPPSVVTPKDTNKIYQRARLLHKVGRIKEAKRLYLEILKVDPGYVDALNNLGVIHMNEKDFSVAQLRFQEAARLKPGYVDPHYNLACIFALKGDMNQSLEHLKRAASLHQSVKDWARRDADLDGLREVPEFKELIRN